ncbi:MAG: phosphotransacetylase family protein [Nitrospirae bacterium]|nr:phosphotransacetylase family protein [Nitrospirota bacterium]
MIPIFIASNKSYSGKTFFALGLGMKLIEQGYKVGYIKPFGRTPVKKGHDVFDADALFMKEALSLPDALNVISPFVIGFETQNLLFEGEIKDAKKRIADAVESQKDKDFVLIGGAGDLFEGAAFEIDAPRLIKDLQARAVLVESWSGDVSVDALMGAHKLLGEQFIGGIINKVPLNAVPHVKETVKPFLEKKGIAVFGVFQEDNLLKSITVRDLNEILNGKALCCEDRLDEAVENFSIGAMDVDSALSYFRRIPNKAVITGAHRSDIQLAAMETSTKCIILTGGLHTNDVVIGKAEAKGIPIISIADDTFTAIDRIESVIGKTRIRDRGKIDRTKEIIEAKFDMERFLKALK